MTYRETEVMHWRELTSFNLSRSTPIAMPVSANTKRMDWASLNLHNAHEIFNFLLADV